MEQQFAHPAPRSVDELRRFLDTQDTSAPSGANQNTAPLSAPENAPTPEALERSDVNAIANLSLDDLDALRDHIGTLGKGEQHAEIVDSVNQLLPNLSDQDQGYHARYRHRKELYNALSLDEGKFDKLANKWQKREYREQGIPMPATTAATVETDSLRQMAKERGADVAKKVAKRGANAAKKVAQTGASVAERTKARATSVREAREAKVMTAQERAEHKAKQRELNELGNEYGGLVGRFADSKLLVPELDAIYDGYAERNSKAESDGGEMDKDHYKIDNAMYAALPYVEARVAMQSFENKDEAKAYKDRLNKDIAYYASLSKEGREFVQESLGDYYTLQTELSETVNKSAENTDESQQKERLTARLKNRAKKIGAAALSFVTIPGESMAFLAEDTGKAAGKLRERYDSIRKGEVKLSPVSLTEWWAQRQANSIVKRNEEQARLDAMDEDERRNYLAKKENKRKLKWLGGTVIGVATLATSMWLVSKGMHTGGSGNSAGHAQDALSNGQPSGNGAHNHLGLVGPNEPGVNGNLSLHEMHVDHIEHVDHVKHVKHLKHLKHIANNR